MWNNDKCRCEGKHHVCKKSYIWNLAACTCENGKYLASIIGDSVIMCAEIIEVEINRSKKKYLNKNCSNKKYFNKFLYFTHLFLSITLVLRVTVSIYCYLIKHRSKQKLLLPYHDTSNKLK